MIEGLPELYSELAITPLSEETLEKRSKTILAIISKKKLDWLLDCVRLYLNKPLKSEAFKTEFIKAFKDDDVMFIEGKNDQELRSLAGAIVNEYVSKKKNEHRCLLGMALLSGSFGIDRETLINASIIDNIGEEIETLANYLRTGYEESVPAIPFMDEIPSDFTEFTSVSSYLKTFREKFNQFFVEYETSEKILRHKVNVMAEESQIHWWLFRSFSTSLQKKFEELDPLIAPVVLAYELYLVTENAPGPVNAQEFLKKAFCAIPGFDDGTDYSIKNAVDALFANYALNVKEFDSAIFGNLCPLIFGVLRSIDCNGDAGWQKVFENLTSVSSKFSVPPVQMGLQLYNEALLCWLKKKSKL